MAKSDTFSRDYAQGTPVRTQNDSFGTIEEVVADRAAASESVLRVRRESDGSVIDVPAHVIDTARSNADEVVLLAGFEQPVAAATTDKADELIIPVREEVLVPVTRETDLGKVIVHKRVEDVPVSSSVDLGRDQVAVERVEINETIDTMPGPRQEGDTLIIPVVEEVLYTEKRLMLREEIRITKQRLTEAVGIEETLKREVVEFEERRAGTIADTLDPIEEKKTTID